MKLVLFYEALTSLRGGVSRCPTHIGVRHLYDTCQNSQTSVGKVTQVSPKKSFFSLMRHSLNRCLTLIHTTRVRQYIQISVSKGICIFLWSNIPYTFFGKISDMSKKVKHVLKQCHQWRIKGINFLIINR
jgi:hypothetical protein